MIWLVEQILAVYIFVCLRVTQTVNQQRARASSLGMYSYVCDMQWIIIWAQFETLSVYQVSIVDE
jgi:hypothetical protein